MTDREQTDVDATLSTRDVAELLGMAVRSVQLMVDRGDLSAWRTPGGHRRISRASVDAWLARRDEGAGTSTRRSATASALPSASERRLRLLYIEDSRHFQKLVSLLLQQRYPQLEVHLADDGFAGLALAGQLQPELLLVDLLLPGLDGATLITSLRLQPAFAASRLIVVTSLEAQDLAPYALALQGIPVVHKPQLVQQLPPLLDAALAGR